MAQHGVQSATVSGPAGGPMHPLSLGWPGNPHEAPLRNLRRTAIAAYAQDAIVKAQEARDAAGGAVAEAGAPDARARATAADLAVDPV